MDGGPGDAQDVAMANQARALPPLLGKAGVTRREADVLEALADRAPNTHIAARLFISVRTVESHISSLLSKLHATDRIELATIARTLVLGPATSARLPLSLLEVTERSPFVGRRDELGLLRERWDEAVSGRRRMTLIVGEAGIGKSRLVAEVAVTADRSGANVLLGHCDQEAIVPYQPIVESLTGLVESTPVEVLTGAVRSHGAELVKLLPILSPLIGEQPTKTASSPEAARYRLFEGAASLVAAACQDEPLLLVFEDLHWADLLSLQFIRHLMRRVDRSRLLVLATVRGIRLDGHLLTLGDDLRREHGAEIMLLRGLDVAEVLTLIAAWPGQVADRDPDERHRLAQRLHGDTDGNPLFLSEVLRHLESHQGPRDATADVGVPQTVRDIVVSRVQGLAGPTRQVLSVAAVAGRRFRADVVGKATELTAEQFIAALEQAQAAGLVDDMADHPGWLEFSHALVRETLEQQLSITRQQRFHRLLGEILEAEGASAHLAELAHHFHAAATPTDHERAVAYAVAAAEEATAKLAHERAATLYGMALESLGLAPDEDGGTRQVDLLLLQAAAYHRGGLLERARAIAMRAAAGARQLGDPLRIADAALAAGESAPAFVADPELTAALSEAVQRIGERDLRRRARLLASLARAEYYSSPIDLRRDLTQQAVAAARAAGHDPTLASVLSARHVALWAPTDAEDRLAAADEILVLAERRGDAELALQGHAWRVVDLLELGEVAAADQAINAHARLARDLGQPLRIRDAALWAATRALLDGRFRDAERESQRALSLGRRAQDPHADMFWWVQRYWLVLEQDASQGDIAALLETSVEFADRYAHVPAWRAKIALLHARLGDREAAAEVFSQLNVHPLDELPRDAIWIGGLYYRAEVASFLEDRTQAAALYENLRPFADRIVVIDRALLCLGAVSRVLGLLAGVIGDRSAARQHLQDALARHEAIGARPLAVRTRVELARLLRDDPTAGPEVQQHLTLAEASARELGMSRLSAQAQQLHDR